MSLHKNERLLMVALVGVLFLGIAGSTIYGYGKSSSTVSQNAPVAKDSSIITQSKAMVQAMEDKLKLNPGDPNLHLELGNQSYDLASELRGTNQEEAILYYNKAVSHYQEFLKTKNDVSVWVDLATAAYYGKDNVTAESAFQKAIQIDSNYYQAHYNYGIFLFHSKDDLQGALQEWKTALTLNPSGQDTERLKSLISGLEKEIAASQGK